LILPAKLWHWTLTSGYYSKLKKWVQKIDIVLLLCRKELVAEIKEKAERKEEMTDGVIAGAIKMLTASNEIMVASRGRYRKGSPVGNQNMQEKVVALFQKFKGDLDKICMVNALNLKEEDFRFITLLNEISNNLESSIWTLEDFGKEGGCEKME